MLDAYLREKEQEDEHKAFSAQMLWYLNAVEYGARGQKFEHPTWLEIMKPKAEDTRSGMEIVRDIKEKLLERKRKRERRE